MWLAEGGEREYDVKDARCLEHRVTKKKNDHRSSSVGFLFLWVSLDTAFFTRWDHLPKTKKQKQPSRGLCRQSVMVPADQRLSDSPWMALVVAPFEIV